MDASTAIDPITAALAAGAAAGLTGVAKQGVKDGYGGLKAALRARFPKLEAHVQSLEARPTSGNKQASLAEELHEVGATQDGQLLQLAQVLLQAIQREAPEAAVRAGVDLQQVRAGGSLAIEDAQGEDVGVHGQDWDVKGDIRIGRARGGGVPDPNP